MIDAASPWNSLEVAKLAIAILTPILLTLLGLIVTRAARRIENVQWTNQKLIERRIELHKEMAPKINDLFCFFATVGHFTDITPPDAIKIRRELDRIFSWNEHLFSVKFRTCYHEFIDSCFSHSVLKARAVWIKEQRSYSGWNPTWEHMFIRMTEAESKRMVQEQTKKYDMLMSAFAEDLRVSKLYHVRAERGFTIVTRTGRRFTPLSYQVSGRPKLIPASSNPPIAPREGSKVTLLKPAVPLNVTRRTRRCHRRLLRRIPLGR